MKLFLIEIDNGEEFLGTADYDHMFKIIAAKNISDASVKAVEFMKKNYEASHILNNTPRFQVTQIEEVDGYKITLTKSDLHEKT